MIFFLKYSLDFVIMHQVEILCLFAYLVFSVAFALWILRSLLFILQVVDGRLLVGFGTTLVSVSRRFSFEAELNQGGWQ